MVNSPSHWFRNTVLYQIYPRSFYDANGDGIGDLEGIRQKLDYLGDLGIGAIWLSPFYKSPMKDFGYDVSDYQAVDPIFGSLDDFKNLLQDAHKKNIKIIIDFIPNHSSDQHPWFLESKSAKDNPRRSWYTWRDPAPDGGPPNNWLSVFGGSAWEYDKPSGQYYLHTFLKEQPDLNWDNAGVRAALCDAAKFWLDLGVDGFRVDTMYWLGKDPHFRDDPPNPDYTDAENPYESLRHIHSQNGPDLYKHFNQLVRTVKSYPEKFMVLEVSPPLQDITESYVNVYEHIDPSVCAPFNFEGLYVPWEAGEFEDFITSFESFMEQFYTPVYCFSNHDKPRIVDRIGAGAARTMAMLQMTLPGLPIVYYGDELGMEGHEIPASEVQDPQEKNIPGKGLNRDPARTPMQWSKEKNAGFSTAKPWLSVHPDFKKLNVQVEQEDKNSMLQLYKELIAFRLTTNTLKHGDFKAHSLRSHVFCYERSFNKDHIIVLLNYTDRVLAVADDLLHGNVVFSTNTKRGEEKLNGTIDLQPHEGVMFRPYEA